MLSVSKHGAFTGVLPGELPVATVLCRLAGCPPLLLPSLLNSLPPRTLVAAKAPVLVPAHWFCRARPRTEWEPGFVGWPGNLAFPRDPISTSPVRAKEVGSLEQAAGPRAPGFWCCPGISGPSSQGWRGGEHPAVQNWTPRGPELFTELMHPDGGFFCWKIKAP